MLDGAEYDVRTGEGLIACPRCDALHIEEELESGVTARCVRCGGVLARPKTGAFTQIIALAVTTMVLMIGAIFFPFLEISRLGMGHGTSLFGVAMAFSDGIIAPLTVAIMATIVALPALRAALLIYTLWPLARRRKPYANAVRAFRLSEQLKPWSMAEIFIIGTAVAMVKVGGLATINFGPAFWAFCALIFVSLANRSFMCSTTIWDAIEDAGAATDGRERVEPA
ncbi:paraquat-inducible protein A [Paracoccus sediminicola]|uniref:paraquat-inducible protein A n=1 Tax=Paracoccus sediminicola TaxID=3017783 RepID=UPI0022F0F9C1|nr:paraquat-inducible protein A [Paracoccus sediminicola]WBU56334.1 paraquat-inducible protein A [Paracoccus sediminicola]